MSAGASRLSLVMVTWNSSALLHASIGAFRKSAELAGVATEVVVIDNASSDDSAEIARRLGAERVVENPLNVGFVVAASQGLALATSDWVLLANPDLVVSDSFVGVVVEAAAAAAPDVAVLVPDIRYASDSRVINSRGLEVDEVGVPAERDAGRSAEAVEPPLEVFGASSSASILRVEVLERIGGLEPAYFAYLEDVDVAWRLRKMGYRALLLREALALHEGSASTGEGSWLKAFLVARNRRILFRLHGPKTPRARAFRVVVEVGHATVQALSGSRGASIRGRMSATRTRRYARFLRASNVALAVPNERAIALAPRFRLLETLQRKQTASQLMHQRPSAQVAAPRRARPSAAPVKSRAATVRVLVEAANLKPDQGGIRTYTMGLIRELARDDRLSLVVASSLPEAETLGDFELIRLPESTRAVAGRALWREANLASLARTVRADVVLAPVPELPARRLAQPSVVVVHDVGPFLAPAFYSRNKRWRYETVLWHACRRASAIVCVSEATLVGLHAAIGVDPRRCFVIGEGPQLFDDVPAAAQNAADGPPFLLYVGSLDARKNVNTLVEAVLQAEPPLPPLVIAGPATAGELAALRRRCDPFPGRVEHLGYVDPSRLRNLYASCLAVVLPSLYEGFGLPVLEAFGADAPVVASDIPAVGEVARDAVLRVGRPLDPHAWIEALRRVSTDAELRETLRARGRVSAQRYTWQEVGARFADVLVATAHSGGAVREAAAVGDRVASRSAR